MLIPVPVRERIQIIIEDPRMGQKEAARVSKISVTTMWRITEHGTASRMTMRKVLRAFPALSSIMNLN